ncbi:hypothetical protein DFS34DRAFT_604452 [Phlyctochytrium arcticum]|nr:hypothetical protein DFS34DRAFT_604452 [Phlyctochytrium arcticum]
MNTDNQRTSWTSQNHSHGSYPPAAQAPLYNPSPSYNNSLPIAPKDPNNSALYVPTATTESDVAAQYSYPHHTAYPSYSPHDDPSSFPIPTPQAPHSSPYPDDDPPQAYPLPQTPSYSPETPTVIAPSPSFYREELPLPSTTSSHPVITTTTTTQETDVDSMMADAGSFLGPPPPPQQSRPTSSLQTWRVPEKAVPHHRPVDQ